MTDSDRTPGLVAVVLLRHGREEDGRPTYVVTRRRQGSHLAGAWELPGGKVEPGEPPTAAARRRCIVAICSSPRRRHVGLDRDLRILRGWEHFGMVQGPPLSMAGEIF